MRDSVSVRRRIWLGTTCFHYRHSEDHQSKKESFELRLVLKMLKRLRNIHQFWERQLDSIERLSVRVLKESTGCFGRKQNAAWAIEGWSIATLSRSWVTLWLQIPLWKNQSPHMKINSHTRSADFKSFRQSSWHHVRCVRWPHRSDRETRM